MVHGRVPPTLGLIHLRCSIRAMHGFVLLATFVQMPHMHRFVLSMNAITTTGRVRSVGMQVSMLSTHASLDNVAWHILDLIRNEVLKKEGA